MTQLSRIEAGAANFALNGAGWTTVSRVDASGGSYSTNTTAGRTATITTPIGTTTTFLGYTARPDAPGNVSYQVDSGPVMTWDQRGLSTMLNDAEYYWYRALSPPISIPNDGGTHIITVTCGTGTTALDFVEHYSPSGATAGKLLTFGHSIARGSRLRCGRSRQPHSPAVQCARRRLSVHDRCEQRRHPLRRPDEWRHHRWRGQPAVLQQHGRDHAARGGGRKRDAVVGRDTALRADPSRPQRCRLHGHL